MKSGDDKKQMVEILLLVGILVFLFLIFFVNLFYFNYSMNADIASDAVLSTLIWNSKEIVPDTWYLANEARIICTPNIAALFYGFTKNMVFSEGLACCVMTLMILLSIAYFSYSTTEMNPLYCLLFCFVSLILPNSFTSLELLYLFASYYAIHVVILFITMGSYVNFIKTDRINWVKVGICILFALLLGLQGTRGILIIYGPLFGMECLRQIYYLYCGNKSRNMRVWMWVLCLLLVSFIGTCFPISVGQDMSRNIRQGILKLFADVLPDFYSIIGFEKTNLLGEICLVLFLMISIGIMIDILWRVFRRNTISILEWGYLVLCSSPVISALAVAFTTVESSERYYFLIFFVMAYGCVLAWKRVTGKLRVMLGLLVISYTISVIFNIYLPIVKSARHPKTDLYAVIDYLIENEYEISYSTFDYANTLTVMSNGEIRVAPVASVERMDICKWMSSTEWYVPNVPRESKTAYIISESKFDKFQIFLKLHEKDLQYQKKIGDYYIYTSDYNFSNLGE